MVLKYDNKCFTFCVLAYNHNKYIIQHLESIKFQIKSFMDDWTVNLIISDDASSDNTVELINVWLTYNNKYFNKIETNYNDKNIGTCAVVQKLLKKYDGGHLKITAGDDMYSNESIISELVHCDGNTILVGRTFLLKERKVIRSLFYDTLEKFSILANQNYKVMDKIKRYQVINAPNTFYPVHRLNTEACGEFLSRFDVVEDLALQIYLAENYPSLKLKFVDKCFVLYRRTSNSTYITANQRFLMDQYSLLTYLANGENKFLRRALLRMRASKFTKYSMLGLFLIPKYIFLLARLHIFMYAWILVRIERKDIKVVQSHANTIMECSDRFMRRHRTL